MKVKTSELSGAALDWAVAKVEDMLDRWGRCAPVGFKPSTNWSQGGPIIEREGIGILFDSGSACRAPCWFATPDEQSPQESYEGVYFNPAFMVLVSEGRYGTTPLIAAMRCFVASKLGDVVEIPEELC